MAGDWIKMKTSLPRDPRVVRISSACDADRLRTVGGILSAWCLFDELSEDGRLDGYTPELMDELVGFPGLARAMERVGWLIIEPEYLEIPRFYEHNGRSAKRRAQEAVRKMSARDADICPHAMRTKSGLEKRREEKSTEKDVYDVPKENQPSSPSQPDPAGSSNQRHDRRPKAMRKPESVEECLIVASRIGVDAPDARAWYADMSEADWRDRDGFPINNWPRALTSHRNILQERRARLGRDKVVAPKTQSDVMAKGLAELDAIFKD